MPSRGQVKRTRRTLTPDSEVIGFTIPKPSRPANEDAMVFRRVLSIGRTVWLLAVADGVSTSARGRDAARMTVVSLWRRCASLGEADPGAFLERAVVQTHHAVRSRFNSTGLASLVAALIFPEAASLVFASVGDSLVCIRDGTVFRQVNPEDVETHVRQMNAETVLIHGLPIIDRAITQGIGIMGGIEPNIGSIDGLLPGSIVCLASDGVKATNLSAFLDESVGMPDMDGVVKFCRSERELSRDDTTLLLLRMGRQPEIAELETMIDSYHSSSESGRLEIISHCERSKWLPSAPLLRALSSEDNEDIATRLVPLLSRSRPPLSQLDLVPELERAILSGRRQLAMRLRDAIRVQSVRAI